MRGTRQWSFWMVLLVLAANGAALGQQMTDTFTRADGTSIGATETPVPGITYLERSTTGTVADVASLVSGQLYISGDGTTPVIAAPGQAFFQVDAPDLTISADVRFNFDNPTTAQASVMAGFLLRKPSTSANINNDTSLGQILVDFMPTGGLYIRQRKAGGFDALYADNPWHSPTAVGDLEKFTGSLPTTVNGLPFDADGDGKLESNEPFRLGAILSGTSLQVTINGQVIATAASTVGTSSSPHNYFSVHKNKWTSTTSGYTGCHVYFDNLQAAVSVPNDTCAGAQVIGDGLTTGQTLVADVSGTSSCGNSNSTPDVWYSYTATCTGDLSIETCGSDFNTVINVFDGCGGTELACNDDCGGTPCTGNNSCLMVPVTQGATYFIRVSGNSGATGTFNLNLLCGPPPVPANDNCASAIEITSDQTTTLGTTLGATTDGVSSCTVSNASPDVWYLWNEPFDGYLTVNTCGTLYNSVVSIYDGCGGTELGCNETCQNAYWCGGPASCLTVPVQGGYPYLIRVSGANGASGPFKLYLEDDVVVRHVGTTNPTTEGWTLNTNAATYTVEPDETIEPAWKMALTSASTLSYSRTMSAAHFNHPEGWTATWRGMLVQANDINQTQLQVIDGADIWVLNFVDGTGSRAKGVYKMLQDSATHVQIGTVDPTDGFHTYQIVYDPATASVSYHVDGVMLSRQTRAEAANNTTRRVLFGDNQTSGATATQSLCSLADFVMRQAPLPPPNDDCTGALVLADGLTTGVTYGATAGGTASCGNSNSSPDIWYTYTASCTGDLTLDTCDSSVDTVLSVYTGTCGGLTEVACNDQCGGVPCAGPASCVTLPVNTGQQYLIRVAGADGTAGVFNLQARCGIPLNDACASATPVTKGTVNGTTVRATADGTASCGTSNSSPSVWYQYNAPTDGLLRLDTCGSALDTVLSLYDGCGGTELACSDDCAGPACTGSASCLSMAVTANSSYWIRVAGNDGAEGDFQLNVQDHILMQHDADLNPVVDEGWTETSAGTFTRGAENEGLDYWKLASTAGSRGAYTATPETGQLLATDFQDPTGWTLTATLRVRFARDVYESQLAVDDGVTDWSLSLVNRTSESERGVYTRPAGGTPTISDRISAVDPSEGYHTYQIVFDPAGDGGNGMVTYYLNGVAIGTQTRSAAPAAPSGAPYRVLWGDNVSSFNGAVFGETPAAAESHVAFVQFEIGQRVRSGPIMANETCATAKDITAGDYYGVTGSAAPDGAATCGNSNGSPDVWYAYTAGSTGGLVVDTCGSPLDTVVSVYDACGGNEVACNDDFCGSQSRVAATVTPGQRYLIRVAGNGGTAGPFLLHVADATPANDSCANALVVTDGATQGTNLGATGDGTASCETYAGGADVWYSYTATCTAPLEVNTCGSSLDTIVSIYDACGGTELACNDDGCSLQSRVETNATQGTTYWIRVTGYRYHQGDFVMNVLCKVPPTNDLCGDAIVITDGTTAGSTVFATSDGDAVCGSSTGSPDVWYSYTATRSGRLKIDASDSTFAAAVTAHSGCPGTVDNTLACGTPIALLAVSEGSTYLIRVAGTSGASGSFNLDLSYDTVVIKHDGQNVPTLEGWTRSSNSTQAVEGPGDDGKPHWSMAQADAAYLNYQFTGLLPSDFADPAGWTMGAIVKGVTCATQWQTHVMLQDGQDTWAMHLIDGTGTLTRGVYATGLTLTDANLIKVSDIDPTADYHLYQISYDPTTQIATFAIDNVIVATLSRSQVYDSTLRRIIWGDNMSAGGLSQGRWNLVQFQFGAQALACHEPAVDADGDGDVDMADFAVFQQCYTGIPIEGSECACFDIVQDNLIDSADYAVLEDCASGPGIPADPNCTD